MATLSVPDTIIQSVFGPAITQHLAKRKDDLTRLTAMMNGVSESAKQSMPRIQQRFEHNRHQLLNEIATLEQVREQFIPNVAKEHSND